jgi:hypothetical protein
MKTAILLSAVVTSFVSSVAFGQMGGGYGGYGGGQTQPNQNREQSQMTTTTTKKTVFPVGVKGYLDSQMANSKDHRFHMSVNGKDLPLTPVSYHAEQKLRGGKTETAVDMKGVDGKVYEMNFVTSGGVVTGGKIVKINGKAL